MTQSYSPAGGGGTGTYLREERDYALNNTPHQLLRIVPGPEDRVTINGRRIFAEVGAEPVRGSPNHRFILRTDAVRDLLEHYRPDIIESLCRWGAALDRDQAPPRRFAGGVRPRVPHSFSPSFPRRRESILAESSARAAPSVAMDPRLCGDDGQDQV